MTSGIIWKGSGLSDGPFIAMLTMGDLKAVWKQLKLLGNYLENLKKRKRSAIITNGRRVTFEWARFL